MDGILPWSDIDPYAGWDDEPLQMHSQEADMQETDTIVSTMQPWRQTSGETVT